MKLNSWFTRSIITINLILLCFALSTQHALAEITAAIIVDVGDGVVTDENGTSDTFTIQLDMQPAGEVSIQLTSDDSDSSEGDISPDLVKYNQGNWKNPKTITVTGLADLDEDGDVTYSIYGVSTSSDLNFDGLVMPAVSVTNLNDPVPIANDDNPSIDDYSPISIPVLENDTALLDLPIEITVVSDPEFGTYNVNPDNTITFTPLETFLGLDQFTYQVCDSNGDCTRADVIVEDQIPPEISSISPVGPGGILEVIDEVITIDVDVTDNFQVDCVIFYRWDAPTSQFIILGEDCEPPYHLVLDVKDLNFGWNQINLIATDVAGNATSSQSFIWLLRLIRTHIPLMLSP
jgi:hypothetical protein